MKIISYKKTSRGRYIITLDNTDEYPYSEERRLFYVGLTRSKKKTYLLVDKNSESIFIEELKKNYKL